MGFSSFLKSPKKEEQQEVPGNINGDYDDNHDDDEHNVDIMDDLERFLGIGEDEDQKLLSRGDSNACQLSWDLMDWQNHGNGEEEDDEIREENTKCFFEEEGYSLLYNDIGEVKRNHVGFWDDDYSRVSLNLNLDYQEVLEAWSDRGSLWAHGCSSAPSNASYMGEVPVMEEEDRTRREASVMRYKEKRQSRLFSKKIRYEVRKLNADKRPRLKGRFVKRVS